MIINGRVEKDENGNTFLKKYPCVEAAILIGVSKRSLDDYLYQLRIGKLFDYDFEANKDTSFGRLRNYNQQKREEFYARLSVRRIQFFRRRELVVDNCQY